MVFSKEVFYAMIKNIDDVILYLNDISSYVSSILYYHKCPKEIKEKLYLNEILDYLPTIDEIIEDIKNYLCNL